MKLSKTDIEHVAWLARLELSEMEKESLTGHLNQILVHFEELQQLDTSQVEPTSHSIPVHNVFREDLVGESMPTKDVLINAPERTEEHFIVPQVVDM
jgi:aspartyl-tRNA(Asn)/glutamyl-tRNA(Gln) amidotransferase subunit C